MKKTTFSLILLVFNLLIIEGSLRIFQFFYPTSLFYRDDYNQYRGKAFSDSFGYPLNSQGFKDKEYEVKKSQGVYRIAGIGDSFAFGVVPYPHNFLTLLEDSLNQVPSLRPVELINMGIPSTGPPHYVAIITNEAIALKPDMLLLSYYIGNDLLGSSRDSRRRKLFTYSHLASILYYSYKVLFGLNNKGVYIPYGDGTSYCDTCSTFKPERYLELLEERSYVYQKNNSLFYRHLNSSFSYLREIKTICDQHNIKLVVVLIPDQVQVYPELREWLFVEGKIHEKDWDNAQPNRLIKAELKKEGVSVIDLLPEFFAARDASPLYIPNDSHWNIRGNLLAAHILERRLPEFIPKKQDSSKLLSRPSR